MDAFSKQRLVVIVTNGVVAIGVVASFWTADISTKMTASLFVVAAMAISTVYQFRLIEDERSKSARDSARDKIHGSRHKELSSAMQQIRDELREEIRNQVTGGDSFCYVAPLFNDAGVLFTLLVV